MGTWLKRMAGSYVTKFLAPMVLGAGLFFVLVFLVLVPRYRSTLLERETGRLNTLTRLGLNVVEGFRHEAVAGRMTEAEAQRRAMETLGQLRYGAAGENYFALVRMRPGEEPLPIMHPTMPNLVGVPLEKLGPAERFFYKTVGEEVRTQGECHLQYLGRKPDEPINKSPKAAYAVEFRPWGWIVCSTMFLDAAMADIKHMGRDMWWLGVLVLALVVALAAVTVWQGRRLKAQRAIIERQLRLSERRYRILFEKAVDGVLLIENRRFSDCNEAMVKMLKCSSKAEVLGAHPSDLSPEFQPDGRRSFEKAEELMRDTLKSGTAHFEWEHKCLDGKPLLVEITLTAIPTDEGGLLLHVVWRDITERKRDERELAGRRAHLEELVEIRSEELGRANAKLAAEVKEQLRLESDIRQVLDASGDALCVVRRDFAVAYANQVYAALVGFPQEQIAGRKCHELLPEPSCGTPDCPLLVVAASGRKLEADTVKTRPDGTAFPCILTCAPFLDASGAMSGVVQTFKDMTKRANALELEKLEAVQQGRLETSNNILHDIGNAVTAAGTCVVKAISVGGAWEELASLERLAQMLGRERGKLEELFGPRLAAEAEAGLLALRGGLARRREGFGDALERMSRSITHINAILNIQRHYLRDARADETLVDMSRLLDDALGLQARELELRDVKVARHYDPTAPPLPGNPARLVQAAMNLLRNACEAFDKLGRGGGNRLSVSVSWEEADGLTVAVIDNAAGFEPSRAEAFLAAGGGLRESAAIVAAHHGGLSLSSRGEGAGAMAAMRFPPELWG